MGNCLPFYPFKTDNDDELTRLNTMNERNPDSTFLSTRTSNSSATSSTSGAEHSESSSRQRYRRNLQPSTYVNELYVSATGADEETAEHKILDEKKRARVRGLLEQLNVDQYVRDGKSDDECAICMIDFVPDEPIRYLPCMHSYHVTCIDDWLLRSFTCPSCMEPVDSAILSGFTVNHAGTTQNLASLPCSTGRRVEQSGSK